MDAKTRHSLPPARSPWQEGLLELRGRLDRLLAAARPMSREGAGAPSGTVAEILDIAHGLEDALSRLATAPNSLDCLGLRVQTVLDAAATAIVVVDQGLRVLAFNACAERTFFRSAAVVQGVSIVEAAAPGLGPEGCALLEGLVPGESGERRGAFDYGGQSFQVVATPISAGPSAPAMTLLAFTDVSHASRLETSLREAEGRYRTILNSVQAGIVLVDAESRRIVDVNDVAAALIGRPKQEILGNVCHRFMCPAEGADCPVGDGDLRVENFERVLLRAAGEAVPVLKTVTPVTLDGRPHLLESFIDITERKSVADALRESEERYRSLYTTMREGMAFHRVLYEEDGRPSDYVIVDVNPGYENILGLSRDRVIGRLASEVYGVTPAPYLAEYARVAHSGEPTTFETQFEPMGRIFSISVVSPGKGQFATIFEDVTDRRRAEDEIQRLAYFDTLTGLPNRTLLRDRLGEALERAKRDYAVVAVLFLDLDRFKPINDSMGHANGDLLLKAVAERLAGCVRSADTVARLGGDEFVVIVSLEKHGLDATRVAQGILDRLSEPFEIDGREVYTSSSLGIALYPLDGSDASALLRNADMAMYEAKDRGRNTYQFFSDEMNRRAFERLELETSLRRALKQGEFFLSYQPQLSLTEGRVMGLEALVRWRHPEYGPVSPARFIPVAEETGLILPLSEWVLRTACAQNKAWQAAGHQPLSVAVNLSGLQFKQSNLVEQVRAVLAESGLEPEYLELELTESILMDDAEGTVKTLHDLKAMGVRLAIDDFGTGYSSLSYLKHFPLDRMKIAQEFVRDISTDPGDAVIVETIIAMARSLGLDVIAEGVETLEQLSFLLKRGCVEMQGFYFARPLPARDLTACFEDWLGEGAVCPFQLR
jgi:diguanylate cyclase (GGDEF)-like protein/PAS domain S-box-containing protein